MAYHLYNKVTTDPSTSKKILQIASKILEARNLGGDKTSFPVKIVPRFCPPGQYSGLSKFPVEALLSG